MTAATIGLLLFGVFFGKLEEAAEERIKEALQQLLTEMGG